MASSAFPWPNPLSETLPALASLLSTFATSSAPIFPPPDLTTPKSRVLVNASALREQAALIRQLRDRFPILDDELARDALEQTDWIFIHALDKAEECMRDFIRDSPRLSSNAWYDSIFQRLQKDYPHVGPETITAAFRRADFSEEYAREYLEYPDLLRDVLPSSPAPVVSHTPGPADLPNVEAPLDLSASHTAYHRSSVEPLHDPKAQSAYAMRVPLLPPPRKTLTVDLHCHTVAEADEKVRRTIADVSEGNKPGGSLFIQKVNFICGRGNHSRDFEPKIRPRVLWVAGDLGCERRIMEANPGIVEVMPVGMSFAEFVPKGQAAPPVVEKPGGQPLQLTHQGVSLTASPVKDNPGTPRVAKRQMPPLELQLERSEHFNP
jgi:hypothetical protein